MKSGVIAEVYWRRINTSEFPRARQSISCRARTDIALQPPPFMNLSAPRRVPNGGVCPKKNPASFVLLENFMSRNLTWPTQAWTMALPVAASTHPQVFLLGYKGDLRIWFFVLEHKANLIVFFKIHSRTEVSVEVDPVLDTAHFRMPISWAGQKWCERPFPLPSPSATTGRRTGRASATPSASRSSSTGPSSAYPVTSVPSGGSSPSWMLHRRTV